MPERIGKMNTTILSGAASRTLTIGFEFDGCIHNFSIPLWCEPHGYEAKHIWGWACEKCWDQVFYDDLDSICEEG